MLLQSLLNIYFGD